MSTQNISPNTSGIISSMTDEQKAGQLFMMAFPGKNPDVPNEMIARYGIGGCYISQENAETFAEARQLSASLQKTALARAPHVPLILGVDQEGAWGVLIPQSVIGPGNLALGVSDDTSHTAAMYKIFARQMSAVGYQTVLGPCADVNINPQNPIIGTRSFGEDPRRVALHVAAAVKALRANGAVATAKHFPGHGDTYGDTHRDIPAVDKPRAALEQQELVPFQAAIDAGVDIIMTSHILYPQLDAVHPATLSSIILTDLLRGAMGFTGIILTDSMNMGAIRKHYAPEAATLQALYAGADIVMLSEEHYDHRADYLRNQVASITAVVRAIRDGSFPEALLNEKLARIIALKQKIAQASGAFQTPEDALSKDFDAAAREAEQKAARHAVRVLANKNSLLPLSPNASVALVNATPLHAYKNLMNVRGIGPNQAQGAFEGFTEVFSSLRNNVSVLSYEAAQSMSQAQSLDAYDAIIAVVEDHPLPGEDFDKAEQHAYVRKLIRAHNEKLIIAGLRSPYDYYYAFADAHCYVCAYSSRTCAAQAAARVIANQI